MTAAGSALTGLTSQQAAGLLRAGGPNELPVPKQAGPLRRAGRELAEPLPLLLLAAAVVTGGFLGDLAEAAAIGAIVLLNTVVAVTQQRRAEAAQRALRDMLAPTARVRRDGRSVTVPAREVVAGDVIELAAGDRVPADATLWHAVALTVDEQVLTGEAFPVDKATGATVSSGTMVTRGRAVAIVERTGPDSAIGRIAASVPQVQTSPLGRELRKVARRMTVVAIVLAAALTPVMWMRAGEGLRGLQDAAMFGVALAVAAIPEGLLAVVTLALAVGGRRLAGHGAIVRHLPAIEALGSAAVLCIDKTGTLTTGRLRVSAVRAAAGCESPLWAAVARCNDADGAVGDPLDVALREEMRRRGLDPLGGRRVGEIPFDAGTRCMATVHELNGGLTVSVKGAPEVVLARCRPSQDVRELLAAAAEAASGGLKVIAFADGPGGDPHATGLRPLGLVTFEDPLRGSARGAVAALTAAGVRIVLVTGDHPETAQAIARAAGLPDRPLVTGSDVAAAADSQELLRSAAVIARVTPEVKQELVRAHQDARMVVAMTGDGVNDAPALRQADVGIAVAGPTGTDVARQAADVIVTDADLATLTAGVREGRRIGRDLTAAMSYLVSGNFSEIAVIVAALLLHPAAIPTLLPVQLLWINLVTDGLPALALATDTTNVADLDRPNQSAGLLPARALRTLVGRGALAAAAVMAVVALVGDRSGRLTQSLMVLALPMTHVLLAFAARTGGKLLPAGWWTAKPLLGAVAATAVLQITAFTVPGARAALGLVPLPVVAWPAAMAAAGAVLGLIAATRVLRRRLRPAPA